MDEVSFGRSNSLPETIRFFQSTRVVCEPRSRLALHDRESHVATALLQSHPSITASTHSSRSPTPQSSSTRDHVGNFHPDLAGSMKTCLSNFDLRPATERMWYFVGAACNQSDGINVPILREFLILENVNIFLYSVRNGVLTVVALVTQCVTVDRPSRIGQVCLIRPFLVVRRLRTIGPSGEPT